MTRRMLTREQALSWIPEWSSADRELIEEHLTRLDAQTFYVPPSGGYVGCVDLDGRVAMTLHYGYLEFRRELAPADLPDPEWPGLTLSTFSPQVSPDRRMLSRELALRWSRDWSDADRQLIEENLTRLDAQTFYVPPSGGYIGCVDADGRVVMTINSGYLEFKRGFAPADLPDPEWPGLTLSTFSPNVSPNRRMLTRQLALDWIQDWSHTDLRIIEENLTRLDAQTFYITPSGGYVGCVDGDGRVVMTLHYGYLEFKRELAPADLPDPDWPGLLLSTFRGRPSPTRSLDDEDLRFCPVHYIALPLTGICDECQ